MHVTDTWIQLLIEGLTKYLPIGLGDISSASSSTILKVSTIVQDRQILNKWMEKIREEPKKH